MEIKNMNEYNPDWHKDKTLVWKKIGEKTGKKGKRKRKIFNQMDISKIIVPDGFDIDENVLEESRKQYMETHKMIPVYLSYDFVLLAGYEQLVLAKELGEHTIPFQRITKMNRTEHKQFAKSVQHRQIGNKKYPIKDMDGNTIYITCNQRNMLKYCSRMARKAGYMIQVTPFFRINIVNPDGEAIKKNIHLRHAKNYLGGYKNDESGTD